MRFKKEPLYHLLSYAVPLFLAGLLNSEALVFKWRTGFLHGGIASSVIILLVYMQWARSVYRRFPQKQMRGTVTAFALLFMMLSPLRVVKYCMVTPDGMAARYLWYAYYVPLIFGPLFMFYVALCFGQPDDYRFSKKWYWLFLPAALLAAGLLTNDVHQQAFLFTNGVADWDTYTRGWLYLAVAVWIP